MRNKKLIQAATDLYSSELPYHNFGHIRRVIKKSEEITTKCKAEGITIDEDVVYYALLFHDAGFHEDHTAKGFATKEAYSAQLAEQLLTEFGFSGETIARIKSAILCTHCDAICQTIEEKIVRTADLSELCADYGVFKENTLDLKEELELMSGDKISWDEWKTMAAERIELFLREELNITSDYYDTEGKSVFHQKTRDNLDSLMSDPSGKR